jgi:hypothetical protein
MVHTSTNQQMLICNLKNAILMYAAEKCGNDKMYPKDIKKRADVSGTYHCDYIRGKRLT